MRLNTIETGPKVDSGEVGERFTFFQGFLLFS